MRIRRSPDRTVEQQWTGEVGGPRALRGADDADGADATGAALAADDGESADTSAVDAEGPGAGRPRHRHGRGKAKDGSPQDRSQSRPRGRVRRFVTWRKLLLLFLSLCALLTGGFVFLYLAIDIPKANSLAKAQSNVYLYSDGSRLARTGEINRETVPLSRVPVNVRNAFVAAENKDFYSDSGVSLSGTARGIASTLTGGGKQGGSTITQQYVKNYYLSQEQTVSRKVKELIISLKVDRHNTKDDILAGYLNSSFYGRQAYGVQAAARAYYRKEVEKLTVEEGAYLAAVLQAPSQYDWTAASPAGKRLVVQRWGYVLDNMVEVGWLDEAARQKMRFPEPVEPKPSADLAGQAGYLVDAARRELIASGVSEQELAGGGWRITLNIDPQQQKALERAVTADLDSAQQESATDQAKPDADRQAGAVSVDPRNGRVLALYGGRDYFKHYLNNATRSDYQAGRTFEPVAYAAELEAKRDEERADLAQTRRTARALGMDAEPVGFASEEAVSLGLMGASPMEMAGVYASFNNEGRKITPSIVKSAQRDGTGSQLPGAVAGQAIAADTAELVTSVLGNGRNGFFGGASVGGFGRGIAYRPGAFDGEGAPVTGTSGPSDDGKADWFVGGNAKMITSIGIFGEDAKTRKQVALQGKGQARALKIWANYSDGALLGRDGTSVEKPGPSATSPSFP
ncbi:transglycosylase domain-containing protein [Streptomyces sp. NPDC051907]|uniref:transglycosylase domain-containing protein n=1 Tax=Streptomyces sp. NPDC051907 TaxID=3155284 RepID=UPI00343759BC